MGGPQGGLKQRPRLETCAFIQLLKSQKERKLLPAPRRSAQPQERRAHSRVQLLRPERLRGRPRGLQGASWCLETVCLRPLLSYSKRTMPRHFAKCRAEDANAAFTCAGLCLGRQLRRRRLRRRPSVRASMPRRDTMAARPMRGDDWAPIACPVCPGAGGVADCGAVHVAVAGAIHGQRQ